MAKKCDMTPSERAYKERFLARVEERRARPFTESDMQRLLAEMESEDAATRADAVRRICPCNVSEEVFLQLRRAAKRLQRDPDPMVRANAFHIEEDARMTAGFESQMERIREREEAQEIKSGERKGKRSRR